jgi:hypothetical protein
MAKGLPALALATALTLLTALPAPTLAAPAAGRARSPVTLAEANSSVDPASTRLVDPVALLRADAADALGAIDWSALRLSRRYAISATIVRLSTASTGARSLAASCSISVAVRDLERSTLLFVVEGRARAEDGADAAARAERDALRAAVQNAIAGVPGGLQRTQ